MARKRFLAPYQWTPEQKESWRNNLKALIDDKWGRKHEFHLRKPQWEWIGARVVVNIGVHDGPKAANDHLAIDTIKFPEVQDAGGNKLPGAIAETSDSIMSAGNVVRPQHYSRFHAALCSLQGDGLGARAAAAQAGRARGGTRAHSRAVSEPLVSLEIGPGEPAERKGLRVLDDGRLEYRGDVEVDLDAHGQAELRSVLLQWRLQWTYTESELEQVRGAIAAADDPPLRAEYGPDTRAIHP